MKKLVFLFFAVTACSAKGDAGANGANGADGAPGKNTLVRLDDEAPGAHCEFGGTAIHTGVDANGDGLLQDDEISGTSYVCSQGPGVGPILEGDFVVHNSYELALLADVTKITGSLTIESVLLGSVSLPKLTEIDGSLSIAGGANGSPANTTSFASLDFKALTKIGTGLSIVQTNIVDLSGFSALKTLSGGSLVIGNNPFLAGKLDFSKVTGALYAADISTNPLVTSFDVTGLDTTTTSLLHVQYHPLLTTISGFDKWVGTGIEDIFIFANDALTALDLHALTSAYTMTIRGNQSLATLDLGALTSVSSLLKIYANPIKQCTLDAVLAHLTTVPPSLVLNGISGTCP